MQLQRGGLRRAVVMVTVVRLIGEDSWKVTGQKKKMGSRFSSMCFIDLPLQKITAAARARDCGRECRTVI